MLLKAIIAWASVAGLLVAVFLFAYGWDVLGFRRDQKRALAKLTDLDLLEASWRLPAFDPWERQS